ncbi:hypothetical protein FGO68_gene14748 [Halteria grandinella]|uniref:Uncharacterized protein n=1 Tax=Halteria grandinella TaxID=5974 RepID=A0A8J8T7E1_HALGN|nr:hypothetical protein FGO68_gene14748 [Halteria grandinella]
MQFPQNDLSKKQILVTHILRNSLFLQKQNIKHTGNFFIPNRDTNKEVNAQISAQKVQKIVRIQPKTRSISLKKLRQESFAKLQLESKNVQENMLKLKFEQPIISTYGKSSPHQLPATHKNIEQMADNQQDGPPSQPRYFLRRKKSQTPSVIAKQNIPTLPVASQKTLEVYNEAYNPSFRKIQQSCFEISFGSKMKEQVNHHQQILGDKSIQTLISERQGCKTTRQSGPRVRPVFKDQFAPLVKSEHKRSLERDAHQQEYDMVKMHLGEVSMLPRDNESRSTAISTANHLLPGELRNPRGISRNVEGPAKVFTEQLLNIPNNLPLISYCDHGYSDSLMISSSLQSIPVFTQESGQTNAQPRSSQTYRRRPVQNKRLRSMFGLNEQPQQSSNIIECPNNLPQLIDFHNRQGLINSVQQQRSPINQGKFKINHSRRRILNLANLPQDNTDL